MAVELDPDRSPSQVRSHGEIGNAGNTRNGSGDVVEDSLGTGLGSTQANKHKRRKEHDGKDSPVPIRTMGGDGLIDSFSFEDGGVGFKDLVASSLESHRDGSV
jgi:hypothetical protein